MLLRTKAQVRPYALGSYPLEALARDGAGVAREAAHAARPTAGFPAAQGSLAEAAAGYFELFATFSNGEVAPARAPLPDDPRRLAEDVKGFAYFLNAAQVGICEVPPQAWSGEGDPPPGKFAVVVAVEHSRVAEPGNPAREWLRGAVEPIAAMRGAEITVCVAAHIRLLGFAARAELAGRTGFDLGKLAVLAGLAVRDGERLLNPFLGEAFSLAAIVTDHVLACDLPLDRRAPGKAKGLAHWWGLDGATSGRERKRRARRATHLSSYPMEQVKRVDRPTTLILDEEVPRVPKRAAFFERALQGDLGERTQHERWRFAYKSTYSAAMLGPIRAMVPRQDGNVANPRPTAYQDPAANARPGDYEDPDANARPGDYEDPAANPRPGDYEDPAANARPGDYEDPAANARAVKSLGHALGADLVGICEIPEYAWFSHHADGREIRPYHRYAVVMLIDQEFDTMEGASGDDWISGAQSMRSYMRGAEIAGVMAEHLRALGFAARPQTNLDSDVQHIPLILWAGLGELSRIGELVLNPFVGPRFKSVVMTTDMPLEVDRPVDFGLQYFCSHCWKCARECPCDAISLGNKVMFNGYEMWKPDVERCARYRLTNSKGSACGRCMKTCPLNKVIDADGPLLERFASYLGVNAMWLKPLLVPIAVKLDDVLGHGKRVPQKKWWLDFEVVDGRCVSPRGINQRDIDPSRAVDPAKQKMAYYPASMMPPPDAKEPVPLDRKAAMAVAGKLESPAEAVKRARAGGAPPDHNKATPPLA